MSRAKPWALAAALTIQQRKLLDGTEMMENQSAFLYWLIVGCEVAFWLLLVLALVVRYVLQRKRLSRALLFLLPAADILLLVVTALDLRAGAQATFAHGLATAYVGFTIAFGSVIVRWADQRFAHRFAGGPPPGAAPARGWPALQYELAIWLRSIVAWVIALTFLLALIAYVDNEAKTLPLHDWFRIAFGSIFFWFAFGPIWNLLFFRRQTPN